MKADDALCGVVNAAAAGNRRMVRFNAEQRLAAMRNARTVKVADVERLEAAISKLNAPTTTIIPREIAGFLDAPKSRAGFDDLVLSHQTAGQIFALTSEHGAAEQLDTHGLKPANRVLFDGPAGTGKTSVALALGAVLGVPVFRVRESVVDSHMGKTQQNFRAIFDFAAGMACIVFMDDVDGMVHKRGDGDGSAGQERSSILVSLLTLCDELPTHTIFVAATNRPEALDPALIRRFQSRVSFGSVEQWQRVALTGMLERRHNLKVSKMPTTGSMAEVEHMVLAEMRAQVCASLKK